MSRVLFLEGLGRNGTTLVERVLGELPGVVALGEVAHLFQHGLCDGDRCGCGETFFRCEFWHAVGARAFGGWQRVDTGRVRRLRRAVERTRRIPRLALRGLGHDHRGLLASHADYYRRIYAAAAEVSGARVVVDSSGPGGLAWCLSGAGLDVRVVHLVRDPRAVAYSSTGYATPDSAPGSGTTRYRPGRTALRWSAHHCALDLLACHGVALIRLRYEEFLADPRASVRTLAAFAGLDPPAAALDFLSTDKVTLGIGHSVASDPVRITTGTVALDRDDRWQCELPWRHRLLIGTACAPLLAAYGYPLRTRPDAG